LPIGHRSVLDKEDGAVAPVGPFDVLDADRLIAAEPIEEESGARVVARVAAE
jgi:hypothetical protein